jgi:hypothetical protein
MTVSPQMNVLWRGDRQESDHSAFKLVYLFNWNFMGCSERNAKQRFLVNGSLTSAIRPKAKENVQLATVV